MKIVVFFLIAIIVFFIMMLLLSRSDFSDDKDASPILDIRDYFDGNVQAWGILEDRKGKVKKKFTVKMSGKWSENRGVLKENFHFDDGENTQRIWKIEFQNDHDFTATADDVVGYAKGRQSGSSVFMKYTMDLEIDKEKKSRYKMVFDDWMYLIKDDVVVNRSKIKKFGIIFAQLSIFFKKNYESQ